MQWPLRDRFIVCASTMELVTSLPADLVALADPSARGAAPLLRPAEVDGGAAAALTPFELCLALLTVPLPTGEAWPTTGKELPVAPLGVAGGGPAAPALDPDMLAAGAADAALLARLRSGAAELPAGLPAPSAEPALPLPPIDPFALAQLPTDTLPPATSSLVQAGAPVEPAAAPAPTLAQLVAQAGAESSVPGAAADAPEPATWLQTNAANDAKVPPTVTPAAEAEAFATPSHARIAFSSAHAHAAEAALAASDGGRRLAVAKASETLAAALPEGATAAADWLPAANGTTSAAAPGAAAATPAAHVDLRSPNWQEAFASRVQVLVGSATGEARITLNPPDLGAVDIKISLVDDKTFVQLTTATSAARDELSQSLPRLRELLTAGGLELGGASVHDGRDGQRAGYGDRAPVTDWRPVAPFAELADEQPAALPRRLLGRVDVFA